MLKYIEKIVKEYKIKTLDKQESYNYYGNNSDYYIVSEYNFKDFIDFFNSEKTNKIVDDFLFKSKNNNDYIKNTSLIILLKVSDIKYFIENYKNQMMAVEEDEYFFRKYIIIYTQSGVDELNDLSLSTLFEMLEKPSNIDKFEVDTYFSDEYFINMQLAIKLPFVTIPKKTSKFISMQDKIDIAIKENIGATNILNDFWEIKNINSDNFYNKFEEEFLDENSEGELLKEVYKIFKDGGI
ncbi:hypothetical protein BKP56_01340 [Marinilactibacillus sp. 15R]|uniref:Uncharacterized protein n=1 Tax=Marinilactibacillus piezotolerans TaxID=258723 RepID=A0A1I3XRC9_9LACT|nr:MULTISPECIES: ABC-three component system middle component 1 [Marinilactibacillus]API88056.1 hypothetical protein BKP56_01340 [Marinilactibacillus sp. 15R]SFK22207.1 hypothetical protein SAMN04488569_101636 [Marinilactibacillus piezotolerans]